MARNSGKVHVVRVRKTGYVDKQGHPHDYSSAYLRRTYRDGGTVKNETVANLSALPDHVVDLIDAGLKGQQLVPAAGAVTITASLPHGHVAAVHALAKKLGLPALLGPAGRHRDLALALIISRVVRPSSKLSALTWWGDTTLGADLGVAESSTDDIYAAMDWLEHRQDAIEAELARRHLAPEPNPARMALFDLSSSWLEGSHCPLAARGYSRDGKKGRLQIEYGLLTDPACRPVAVRVFPRVPSRSARHQGAARGAGQRGSAGPCGRWKTAAARERASHASWYSGCGMACCHTASKAAAHCLTSARSSDSSAPAKSPSPEKNQNSTKRVSKTQKSLPGRSSPDAS